MSDNSFSCIQSLPNVLNDRHGIHSENERKVKAEELIRFQRMPSINGMEK